jgi:hypothetical protein
MLEQGKFLFYKCIYTPPSREDTEVLNIQKTPPKVFYSSPKKTVIKDNIAFKSYLKEDQFVKSRQNPSKSNNVSFNGLFKSALSPAYKAIPESKDLIEKVIEGDKAAVDQLNILVNQAIEEKKLTIEQVKPIRNHIAKVLLEKAVERPSKAKAEMLVKFDLVGNITIERLNEYSRMNKVAGDVFFSRTKAAKHKEKVDNIRILLNYMLQHEDPAIRQKASQTIKKTLKDAINPNHSYDCQFLALDMLHDTNMLNTKSDIEYLNNNFTRTANDKNIRQNCIIILPSAISHYIKAQKGQPERAELKEVLVSSLSNLHYITIQEHLSSKIKAEAFKAIKFILKNKEIPEDLRKDLIKSYYSTK